MILALPLGIAAGLVAAFVLAQLLLPGEVATVRSLARLASQIGGEGGAGATARWVAVGVGALAVAVVVGRVA